MSFNGFSPTSHLSALLENHPRKSLLSNPLTLADAQVLPAEQQWQGQRCEYTLVCWVFIQVSDEPQ